MTVIVHDALLSQINTVKSRNAKDHLSIPTINSGVLNSEATALLCNFCSSKLVVLITGWSYYEIEFNSI